MVWKTVFWIYMFTLVAFVSLKGLKGLPELWAERAKPGWAPSYNIRLLRTVGSYLRHYGVAVYRRNIWGNILPFIPMGFLMPAAFPPTRGFFRAAGLCLLIINAIETMQFVTGLGSFDVDDILLNTVSCVFGYAVYKLFAMPRKNGKPDRGRNA
ncbi:MAG: VanZ family protein [Oscillospiraceae bacterium]|nr:VanZ family protein [Oscillospiraceae bacterium]